MNPTTGERCNFFRWLPGSRTPSVSPRLGSTSQLPAFTHPSGPGPLPFVLFPGDRRPAKSIVDAFGGPAKGDMPDGWMQLDANPQRLWPMNV